MGKKIDRFVLSLVLSCAFYLYFFRAFGSQIAAILLAILCSAVLRKTLRLLGGLISRSSWHQKRRLRRKASGTIMMFAGEPLEEAHSQLSRLMRESYGAEYPLAVLQEHPSLTLDQSKLFSAWKDHQGLDRLVVCATCKCDASCRLLASSLHSPKVALLDAEEIANLIAEQPECMSSNDESDRKQRRFTLYRIRHMLVNRKNVPRCLLFSASSFAMYALGASSWYLWTALFLLMISLISLKKQEKPAKLF